MANTRISDLTASASNLASTDLAPVVQTVGVGPVKMTGLQLAGGLLGSTTFNGSTVTTSSPVLNLTQTWNAGAVTFTGLLFNAATGSNANSASGSLLLDLQLEGASKFKVTKAGATTIGGTFSVGSVLTISSVSGAITTSGNVQTNGGYFTLNGDVLLTRAAAATLQLGAADAAAPVAQTFKVQSGTAGASATTVSISGTSLTIAGTITGTIAIGHAVTGTGVSAGTLITAGSGTSWTVNNSQTVGPITAYFNSVGADFTIRGSQGSGPSAGGSLIFQVAPAGSAATTAQNAYSTALTIDSSKNVTAGGVFISPNTSTSVPGFQFAVNGGFYVGMYSSQYAVEFGLATTVGGAASSTYGTLQYNPAGKQLTFGAGSTAFATLAVDAANTLALRNGTSAQRFNVYNTYTSSTNYETFKIDWITTANTCLIGTEKGSGGGTARALELQTDGTTRLTISTNDNFTFGSTFTNKAFVFPNVGYLYGRGSGIFQLSNSSDNGFDRLQFGGTSSSFPALKRIASGNCLQVIAADNTASAGFIVGNQALATSATDGFLYVPTCAGTPTGTPTTQTGTAPIVVDTTNNKLYFYSGGQWRDAGP